MLSSALPCGGRRTEVPGALPIDVLDATGARLILGSWGAETLRRTIGFYRTTASLMLVDADNELLHDFGQFPGAERIGTETGSRPHPFGKALVHAIGPGGIYVGTGNAHELRIFDPDGALRRIIRWMGADLAYSALRLDPDGNLWVRGFSPPGTDSPLWTVFAPTGALRGEIALPNRFEALEIGRDYVLGVHQDELDVERVQRYSLIKPDQGAS